MYSIVAHCLIVVDAIGEHKSFKTKAEAQRWLNVITSQAIASKDWNKGESDQRRLSEYIDMWYQLSGKNLTDTKRYPKLVNICKRLGDPVAQLFEAKHYLVDRANRLESGISENTVNHELVYLKRVYNFMIELGETERNPLLHVKKLKHHKFEAEYLEDDQIRALVHATMQSEGTTWLCVLLGFSTGGRWSEVSDIAMKHIKPSYVKFVDTKSKKSRVVPITQELYKTLRTHCPSERLRGSYEVFRNAVGRAGIELPKGQSMHVMRHTFASHFMINGGDILTLQRLLGHSSLQMTMLYAHLAPNALDKAKALNPVSHQGLLTHLM